MKTLKIIGYFLLTLSAIFILWFAASFVDIASKNHVSDKNYKGYHDWNLIIIVNDYCLKKR